MAGQFDMSEFPLPAPGFPDPVEFAELAVATRTPLLLTGLASAPLTMLARRITTIMPPLRYGEYAIRRDAPLRAPHSSVSRVQLAREAEDARGGVLYLDEVEDFRITRDFIETLSRVLAGPNPPLLVATMLWRPMENSKLSSRIKQLADRGLEFPLQVDVRNTLALPARHAARNVGGSYWTSAAIRARIESYDPENRLIAHDLVAEGKIEDAWKILRGEVVERSNPALSRQGVDELFGTLIREPGSFSLQAAQDLLEEQNLTLFDVSVTSTKKGTATRGGSTKGRFVVSASRPVVSVEWQVIESDASSNYPGKGWHALGWVVSYKGQTWRDERSGQWQNLLEDEAIFRAVEHAWFIVKVMKRAGLDLAWKSMQNEIEGRTEYWDNRSVVEQPVTPPWLISAFGEHRRPKPEDNPREGGSMPPTPSARALKMYVGFHQRDPKKVGTFHAGLKIPATAMLVGDAVHVLYKSDKLNPTTGIDEGWIDYIHEHKAGVKVYRCDRNAGGPAGLERRVPQWIQNVTELEWLGQCKGFAFADDDGVHEAKGTRPYPELFTTTNGKALLVIQNKRTLLAIIWGGKLGVEPRGIVN